nr:sarcalumenin [Leptinotarsa decemlineata]
MEVYRRSSGLLLFLGLSLLATTLQGVQGEVESEGPSESECRPYIEKALKELETGEPATGCSETNADSGEDFPTVEISTDDFAHRNGDGEDNENNDEVRQSAESVNNVSEPQEDVASQEQDDQPQTQNNESEKPENEDASNEELADNITSNRDLEDGDETGEDQAVDNEDQAEDNEDQREADEDEPGDNGEQGDDDKEDIEEKQDGTTESKEENQDGTPESKGTFDSGEKQQVEQKYSGNEKQLVTEEKRVTETVEQEEATVEGAEDQEESDEETTETNIDEESEKIEQSDSDGDNESAENNLDNQGGVDSNEDRIDDVEEQKENKDDEPSVETNDAVQSVENNKESVEELANEEVTNDYYGAAEGAQSTEYSESNDELEHGDEVEEEQGGSEEKSTDEESEARDDEYESAPVEDLTSDIEIPSELRARDHVEQLLKVDEDSSETEKLINKVSDITLKELKKLYENAIKPLEVLYKYRELSNRHFGDAEIFSKPLILFMGPWSGGKSSIINYLVNNEYNETSLRTGAEPSPAYFNILMYGDEPEIVDGTELAADFTFAGLQKFGQGLEERLQGVKLPMRLLEKVNIVEIPGILEVRKQISRVFPFNDACQWFIDRADIIFLVYDPSKLDVGPETEAILDQLKGREHQTRIILNKADQVKPEELMRVQGALIWNISPLMSSPQPPVMYTVSLWSKPYEPWAPARLLQAQERAFLRDLRGAIDKRIDNKIASARRFAVRVRNHAKMVDCYLTTYYNHKSVFGNRKQVADEIIERPQDYHIYEGLSTLTNISRYDLPDPDVYRDFFKLNPLYEFQPLSATCTYFRGCPINRLDVAIAYDLPELVGTHKKLIENTLTQTSDKLTSAPGS